MINKILNFIKIEHTAFSVPLLFTGAWLGGGHQWPGLRIIVLIVVAATGARIFGMSFNRIFDRHIDAKNPRTAGRELPLGSMGVGLALTIAFGGLALYLAACALLNRWCLYLAPVPLIPLLGYSLLKRVTSLCHFGIGLCMALAPLGAFVAATGSIQLTWEIRLFSLFVFFWLSGADIIYALLDMEVDRRTGIHSLPAKMGSNGAQAVAAVSHVIALAALVVLLHRANAGWPAWSAFGVTIALFIMMYLPAIPIPKRFFPISTLAGVAGAVAPLLL